MALVEQRIMVYETQLLNMVVGVPKTTIYFDLWKACAAKELALHGFPVSDSCMIAPGQFFHCNFHFNANYGPPITFLVTTVARSVGLGPWATYNTGQGFGIWSPQQDTIYPFSIGPPEFNWRWLQLSMEAVGGPIAQVWLEITINSIR